MTDLYNASRAAEQAAYAAGTHLQASRSRLAAVVITQQAPADVVASIAAEARALIREVVQRRFPAHGLVGDSDDAQREADGQDGRPCWVVEPIDGLANYLRGFPHYAVSIALVEAGEPQVSVVYDPCRNEFFGAIRGHGAVFNGQAMRCARPHLPGEALVATVFPKPGSERMRDYLAEFGRVVRGFGGVRRSGSMGLEMAYLAAGRIDAFWQHDLGLWGAAAGAALLRESGALLHARDGLRPLECGSLLACTPSLFEPFLSLLAEG